MKKILTKKRYLFIILAVMLIILLMIRIAAGMRGVQISSAVVTRGDLQDVYTEKGVYKMGTDFQVVSKISGSVDSVAVYENMEVKKGDILVIINDRDLKYEKELHESALLGYQAQLDQSNFNQIMATSPQEYLDQVNREMTASQAQYQAAKTSADGTYALYQAGSVSKVEWERIQAEYRNAETAYIAAKNRFSESQTFLAGLIQEGMDKETLNNQFYDSMGGQLRALIQSEMTSISQLEEKIEDCIVVAECDGNIMSLPAKDMNMIQAGQVVAIINSNQEPVIEADILTNIEPYLRVGSAVNVTQKLRNQEHQYSGTISEIYNFAVQGTSALGLDEYRVRVKVKVDTDQEILLKSGYSFDLQFTLYEGADELIVPINAVFESDQQDFVFVIENGYVTKKPVSIGYRSSFQVAITDGLEEGEKVVTNVDSEDIYEGLKGYY